VMETDNDKRYVLNEWINCKKHKHAMAIETNSQILLCISSQCCVKFWVIRNLTKVKGSKEISKIDNSVR
jgi:general stress protein 26